MHKKATYSKAERGSISLVGLSSFSWMWTFYFRFFDWFGPFLLWFFLDLALVFSGFLDFFPFNALSVDWNVWFFWTWTVLVFRFGYCDHPFWYKDATQFVALEISSINVKDCPMKGRFIRWRLKIVDECTSKLLKGVYNDY